MKPLHIAVVVVVILLLDTVGSYLLFSGNSGFKIPQLSTQSPPYATANISVPNTSPTTSGWQKLTNYYKTYPALVRNSSVMLEFKGDIKAVDSQRLTISAGGQDLEFPSETFASETVYRSKSGHTSAAITRDKLKAGDTAEVAVEMNPFSGNILVTSVFIESKSP